MLGELYEGEIKKAAVRRRKGRDKEITEDVE